ncbi:MAG: ABC transporter permease [Acidobacteriota bacterium]|nr:ABC transporter permease [Acidobacteriota bacterium]
MMIPFRALVRRDLQLFFSDRRAVLMSFVAPIVIASFFGYIFGGASKSDTSRIPVLAIDQDGSAISRELIARLGAEKALDVKPSSLDAAREAVRKGKATVAVSIPKDFGADAGQAFFGGAKKPEIGVMYDPSHSAELGMVQGILTGDVMQVVSKEMFTGSSGREIVKQDLAQLERSGMPDGEKKPLVDLLQSVEKLNEHQESSARPGTGLSMPYQIHEESVTAGKGIEYNGYAHSFAGMGVQFILFMGIEVGIGILLQRQRGLWKRLRAAPLSRGLLLGSRTISAALTAMLILMVLFGFARLVFGVRIEGSVAGFLGVCVAFALMTATFGLMIAALGKTPEATRGLAIFATLIMVMLGGAWVPTFVFPQWLQNIAVVVPTRWAVDGLDAMTWRGLGFSAAVNPIAALLGFALVFGALAVTRFRWEADS